VPRTAKPFFIHVVHRPPGVMGHMAAPKLPSQKGRVQSRRARDSTGAHLIKEARTGAVRHVVTPEPTSAERCDLKLQLTWQHVNTHCYLS
jgi:hypothetical protein